MTISLDRKLDAILDAIKSLELRVARIETGGPDNVGSQKSPPMAARKRISIKEFLLGQPPKNDIQRTLAVGYFLETHAGMVSFTRADLEKGYSDAKEPAPSNTSMNIQRCIRQGYMMEAEEKKNNKTAYIITRSGEQYIKTGYKNPRNDK